MVSRASVAAYVVTSFIACGLFLADYANTYREFYPAMVALANSSSFRLLMVNTAIALTVVLWLVLQLVFFGRLNASEETALLTAFTLYMVECVVVPLYVDQPIMSATSFFFLFTLAWRVLHKLAAERVTTLSTVQVTWVAATRMCAYLCFAIICDVGLLVWMFETRPELTGERASMHYSILLIYVLLLISSLRSTVQFASLFLLPGQHSLLPYVADAVTSIAESLLFVGVYAYIFYKSVLPLLLLRGFVGHVLRIFEKTSGLAEFLVLARRVRNSMPDATAEDLARDGRCTICYEDMVPGSGTKRLPCGHCYHIDCLERWLEGHSTCPYCRANIMQMRGGAEATDAVVPAGAPEAAAAAGGDGAAPVAALADAAPPREGAIAHSAPRPAAAPTWAGATAGTAAPQAEAARAHEEELARGLHSEALQDMEREIREAYERYRQQLRSPSPGRAAAASAAAGAAASSFSHAAPAGRTAAAAASQPCAAAATRAVVAPLRPESPVSDDAASQPTAATAPATPKSVEQLKLKAYKRYHKKLAKAEKELRAALRLAEEQGYDA